MSDNLIPCPFCGSEDLEFSVEVVGDMYAFYRCNDCFACGPSSSFSFGDDKSPIVELWNERTPHVTTIKDDGKNIKPYACMKCGHEVQVVRPGKWQCLRCEEE